MMEWFHHHGLYHCGCLLNLSLRSFRNQKLVFPTIRSTMFVCKWPLTKCHAWQNIETCYHGGFKPMQSKPSVPSASTSFGIMPTHMFVSGWKNATTKTNEAKTWTQTIWLDYVWDSITLASSHNCFSKAFIRNGNVTTHVIPTSPASNLATHPPPLRSILLLRNLLPIGHHLLHLPATAPKPNHSALDGVFSHHWLGKSVLNWTQVDNDDKKHVGNCNHPKKGDGLEWAVFFRTNSRCSSGHFIIEKSILVGSHSRNDLVWSLPKPYNTTCLHMIKCVNLKCTSHSSHCAAWHRATKKKIAVPHAIFFQ